MKFVVLIPVGPKKKELDRLSDLLASLFHFEAPEECGLLLVNDGNSTVKLQELCSRFDLLQCGILENPRNGRGEGWSDGLAVGILAGLRRIAKEMPLAKFVIKLDTDSLVINPFADQVNCFFDQNANVGLVGSYLREPGGVPKNSIADWSPRVGKLRRPFTVWKSKDGWHFQCGFWSRDRQIQKLIREALHSGYVLGESCQGGGYALSAKALQKFNDRGLLDDCFLFLNRRITEDIIVGLFTRVVRMAMADFNDRGQPFGVVWRGLCAPPPELLRHGYAIVHSVKDTTAYLERETRTYFAEDRKARYQGRI